MSGALAGQTALVTGGSRGIGFAISQVLAQDGARVAIVDIDEEGAVVAAARLEGDGHAGYICDVGDPGQCRATVAAVTKAQGVVTILINNAGITGSLEATRLHETPVKEWDRVMGVNVRGAYLCSRAALSAMVPRGSGHIITVASVAGMDPFPSRSAYSVSKAAALLLARSIALDYAGDGIRSNAVCPGMAETPMTKWRLDQPDLRAAIEAGIPIGRVAQPEEVAEAITLLASGRLSYMTGHGLVVDGGWSLR